eukprot:XP_011663219.1 PREDICTED: fibropellin-3 [Strongylocentrotus purpuratus]
MFLVTCLILISFGCQAVYSECILGVKGLDDECILCSDQPCVDTPSLCPDCPGPCDTQPCLNGKCTNLPHHKYTCTCEPLWTGDNCSLPVVGHCGNNPCRNGNCTSTADVYTCTCKCGWTGKDCDTEEDTKCGTLPQGSNVCIILAVVLLRYVLL